MNIMSNVVGAWSTFSTKIMLFLPNVLAALVIFILGWLAAKIVKSLIIKILGALKFDALTEKAGINALLTKANIYKHPREVLALLTYWFLLLIVIVASFDTLGLPVISELLNKIVLYIPNIIAAIVVLIFGAILGNFLAGLLETVCSGLGKDMASLLSKVAKYSILILAITMALQQLNIAPAVVTAAFSIFFGALCLAWPWLLDWAVGMLRQTIYKN